jgi:hypothetical protein
MNNYHFRGEISKKENDVRYLMKKMNVLYTVRVLDNYRCLTV